MPRAAWALLLFLGGCSIVNDPATHQRGGVDAGPSLTPEELCHELSILLCRARFECCLSRPPEGPDFEDCVETLDGTECGATLGVPVGDLISDPRLGYDPHIAAEVIAEGHQRVGRCELTIFEWYTRRDGIWRMLQGTIPPGSSCMPDESVRPFDYRIAFACRGTDHRCLPSDESTWTCAVLGTSGQRCIGSTDCMPGLYCRDPLLAGTCDDRRDERSTCTTDDACESFYCEGDLVQLCRQPASPQDVYCR